MYTNNIYKKLNIDDKIVKYVDECEKTLSNEFSLIDRNCEYNQLKVLKSFHDNKLSDSHFTYSTGYGYDDKGRDIVEAIYKDIFNAEDALVRQQFVSGTHAISTVIFALTRPGDEVLSICGDLYDTLDATLGKKESMSSIIEYNIKYKQVDLINEGFDYKKIKDNINEKTKLVLIQRSRGYSKRHSFSIEEIKNVISNIRQYNERVIIFVDNCYGEFVDTIEPTEVGADIIAGSLIKNIGGGIARTGAYIVGRKDLIDMCAERLTAPGIGKEVGISFGENINVLMGLFFAPKVVADVLKGLKLFSKVYNNLKINTYPRYDEVQNDIILAIELKSEERLEKFCKAIQSVSCVDSFYTPLFDKTPGYESKIIMAAGDFIQGSSIELSCDGPLKEPYIGFLQGGLSYYQIKYALMKSIKDLEIYDTI